jgi:hypothetical protein
LRFKVSKFSAALGYLLEVPWLGRNALLGKKNKKRTPAPAGDSDRKLPSTISYNFKTRWWYNIVSHPAPSSYNEQVNNACWTFSGPQAVPPQTKKSQHSSCCPDVWSHDALGTQIISQSFGAPFHTYWVLAPLRIFWNLGERGDARFRRTTLEFERFVKAVVWIKMCFEDFKRGISEWPRSWEDHATIYLRDMFLASEASAADSAYHVPVQQSGSSWTGGGTAQIFGIRVGGNVAIFCGYFL